MDDEREVKRQRKKNILQQQYKQKELKDVLDTYSGRAVLYDILINSGVDEQIGIDPYQAQRDLGRRDIGLWLKRKILTINSDSVIIMEKECKKREEDLNF